MKVNTKLKFLFVELINTKVSKKRFNIVEISYSERARLIKFIYDLMVDDAYFVFTEGSTKFNEKLEIILRSDIQKYFSNNYIIYSLNTLDYIRVGDYEGFNNGKSVEGIDVDVTGAFTSVVNEISKNFVFNIDESKLPK